MIVDDGSRDATGARAAALARPPGCVRVVHHPTNRGYGAAIRSGLAAARHEWVFYTDGDRQFDPRQITRLIAELPHADVVVGMARAARRSRAPPAQHVRVEHAHRAALRPPRARHRLRVQAHPAPRARGADARGGWRDDLDRAPRVAPPPGLRIAEVPVDHFPRTTGTPSGNDPRVDPARVRELAGSTRASAPSVAGDDHGRREDEQHGSATAS
jgi:glycosyltransferase involved in cell wall biosynthesis